MTTTAQYREAARQAAAELDWSHAAFCWAAAIEAYPNPRGALAQLDLERMTQQRDVCRRMATVATAPGPEHY